MCIHCSVVENENIDLKCFPQFSSLDANNVKRLVNNKYELRNYKDMTSIGLTKHQQSCVINKSKQHSLVLDDNNGKPTSILQNSIFDVKNVHGFGDCGFLAVILLVLSNKTASDEISSFMLKSLNKHSKN